MALDQTTILEIQSGGSDNNGGGFATGFTFANDLSVTNATTAFPTVTAPSYTFVGADVGYHLFIKSGTNFIPGWYKVASVAGGLATIDAQTPHPLYPDGISTTIGCASVSNPTGGMWGMDYSINPTARHPFTDLKIDATTNTKFTSALRPVGPNFIGNVINITSGTNFTVQRVQVITTASGVATCDKALGTLGATGGQGQLGGCLASPGISASVAAAGNTVYWKKGTYQVTSIGNTSGGRPLWVGGVSAQIPTKIIGYDVNRYRFNNDVGPSITAAVGTSATLLFNPSGAHMLVRNIRLVNLNACATITGLNPNPGPAIIENCYAENLNFGFNVAGSNNLFLNCQTVNCNGGFQLGNNNNTLINCFASGGLNGFLFQNTFANNGRLNHCIAVNQSGTNAAGITICGIGTMVENCIVYNTTGTGSIAFYIIPSQEAGMIVNCIAHSSAIGFYGGGSALEMFRLINCAAYNCPTIDYTVSFDPTINVQNFYHLTQDPFVDPVNNNFLLSGNGAILQGVGYPNQVPGLTPVGQIDIGVYQSGSKTFLKNYRRVM